MTDSTAKEGIRLFNGRKFFEAHEVLETVWLKAEGDDKIFLHGLIQVAAAFHHQSRENIVGCRSLLEKGCRKLARFGAGHMGVDLARFLAELQPWREFLEQSAPASPPPWPRIQMWDEPRPRP